MEKRKKDSAKLVWDSKPKRAPNPKDIEFQTAEVVVPNPARDLDQLPLSFKDQLIGEADIDKQAMNRLIWGDNLLAMQALLAQGYEGKIDLIYIDPPFDSKADYSHRLVIDGEGFTKEPSVIERLAYKDTWAGGSDSYLDMLYPRLQLMKRLLSGQGSIYVHLDWHVGHYVKILLDEVFGKGGFRNDVVWTYGGKGLTNAKYNFVRSYGRVLFYTKGPRMTLNLRSGVVSESVIKRFGKYMNEDYQITFGALRNSGDALELGKATKGFRAREGRDPCDDDIARDYGAGSLLRDVWDDIAIVRESEAYDEYVGYPTQKPMALLERIIRASSNQGDMVADFFLGSGTTAVVAERMGRRWIGCELGKVGMQLARSSLVRNEARPFLIENIGNYQREMIYLHGGKIHEMQRVILKLYDAVQRSDLPDIGVKIREDKLGRDRTELVHVGYPDRPVTAKKVEEVLRSAEKMDGIGYPRVVFLAWDYEPNFDQAIEGRKKAAKDWPKVDFEARMIPPDIYDYLKQAKDEEEVEKLREKVQFYEKPYLRLGEPVVKDAGDGESEVSVSIKRYVVFDFPVKKEADRAKLRELAKDSFAVLIDYWAVDWDYDGFTFKSQWQDFRGFGKRAKVVGTVARETLTSKKEREIAVRVVDIFGNDASASVKVRAIGK